jgi:hypothetical protein
MIQSTSTVETLIMAFTRLGAKFFNMPRRLSTLCALADYFKTISIAKDQANSLREWRQRPSTSTQPEAHFIGCRTSRSESKPCFTLRLQGRDSWALSAKVTVGFWVPDLFILGPQTARVSGANWTLPIRQPILKLVRCQRSLAPTLVTFTLITRTASCSRQLPSCFAVYPRDIPIARVLCLARRSLGEGGSLIPQLRSRSRVFYVVDSLYSQSLGRVTTRPIQSIRRFPITAYSSHSLHCAGWHEM